MMHFIDQLHISYRPNLLFLTALIYINSWSYSKQTNSHASKGTGIHDTHCSAL